MNLGFLKGGRKFAAGILLLLIAYYISTPKNILPLDFLGNGDQSDLGPLGEGFPIVTVWEGTAYEGFKFYFRFGSKKAFKYENMEAPSIIAVYFDNGGDDYALNVLFPILANADQAKYWYLKYTYYFSNNTSITLYSPAEIDGLENVTNIPFFKYHFVESLPPFNPSMDVYILEEYPEKVIVNLMPSDDDVGITQAYNNFDLPRFRLPKLRGPIANVPANSAISANSMPAVP